MATLLLLACLLWPQVDPQATPDSLARATAAVQTLQAWYLPDTGLWRTTEWWNSANGITALVRYSVLSGSTEYRATIDNTFERNRAKNFLNEYYDDEGWWALAWADAYAMSRAPRYLEMSQTIFADMAASWDDTCGGGIWWKKDRHYKNAIANELFLYTAARLASLTDDPEQKARYLDWAQREWRWFEGSGMINANHLVNDGLNDACRNNQHNTWTYNQGVILGGLTLLSQQAHDPKLLESAHAIATAAIAKLSDADGILHDTCEPKCGADGVQFKGIFVRDLSVLQAVDPRDEYAAFFQRNADAIWKNRDSNGQIGEVWSATSGTRSAATQISALDALLASIPGRH